MSKQEIKVTHAPGDSVRVYAVMASAIEQISKSMKELSESRVSRNMIVTLIHANSRIGKKDIEIVLNNLESLEETWLNKRK